MVSNEELVERLQSIRDGAAKDHVAEYGRGISWPDWLEELDELLAELGRAR